MQGINDRTLVVPLVWGWDLAWSWTVHGLAKAGIDYIVGIDTKGRLVGIIKVAPEYVVEAPNPGSDKRRVTFTPVAEMIPGQVMQEVVRLLSDCTKAPRHPRRLSTYDRTAVAS